MHSNKKSSNQRKRRRGEFELDEEHRNYQQLYLREKQRNERLLASVRELKPWKAKYMQLYAMMNNVLEKDAVSTS